MKLILNRNYYKEIVDKLRSAGYADEIEWARNIKPCTSSWEFAYDCIWVILNSGMKNQVAQKIWERIKTAWKEDKPTSSAFGHKGKVSAIDYIRANRDRLFWEYNHSEQPIEFLKSLPWIGEITCWHLAKNLGYDCVKPDRHLVRIANEHNMSPAELCNWLADREGERVATIDTIIWRACNLGIL